MKDGRMLVSILGDSLSTFEGYQPEGYAVFFNEERKKQFGLQSVYDMWWARVNVELQALLCVNNAFSGSRVTGTGFPAASSHERIKALRTEKYTPDLILVYIGTNDFGYGVPLFGETARHLGIPELMAFSPAYGCMLDRIKAQYPRAKIICSTLMRTTQRGNPERVFPERKSGTELEAYNRIIRAAVREKGCLLADIGAMDRTYETIDGWHPSAEGHRMIAECWMSFLRKMI